MSEMSEKASCASKEAGLFAHEEDLFQDSSFFRISAGGGEKNLRQDFSIDAGESQENLCCDSAVGREETLR